MQVVLLMTLCLLVNLCMNKPAVVHVMIDQQENGTPW